MQENVGWRLASRERSAHTGNLCTCAATQPTETWITDSVYNCVHRMVLEPSGVVFRGRRAARERHSEFLGSLDPWFRPTSSRTGPDGALWVVDMCRIVIEHPEFIDDELEATLDLREGHELGRIWRIHPTGKAPRPIPRLDRLDTPGLVAALDTPN